jgi:hypothetical protein
MSDQRAEPARPAASRKACHMQTDDKTERGADRRGSDRRKAQITDLPHADRRKSVRRSGDDRRGAPRTTLPG